MDRKIKEILKDYIKECLNQGFTHKEIIDYIEKKGFHKEEIEEMTHLVYHRDHHDFFIKIIFLFIPLVVLAFAYFVFNINIPIMAFIIAFALALLIILIMDKDAKRMLFLILIAFFSAEIVLIKYDIEAGLGLYSIFLAFLILSLIFRKFRLEIKEGLFIIGILPLMRLLGSLLPIEGLSFPLRVTAVYSVILAASFIALRNVNLKKISSNKGMGFLPLAIIIGMILGLVEFLILRPSPTFESFSINAVLLGLGIMGLTGLAEEFIFRGMMQNHFLKIFNVAMAITLTNLIFAAMHLIWLNLFELAFVFGVGMLCGAIYYNTKNLILVSSLHGAINFSLFVLFPLIMA